MEARKIHPIPNDDHFESFHRYPDSLAPELDIIDILAFFLKHAKLLTGFTLSFALLGLVVGLTWPQKYTFNTVIEIGRIPSTAPQNQLVFMPIANQTDILTRINAAMIPNIVDQFAANNNNKTSASVSAKVEKNSSIITLESKAKLNAKTDVIALQTEIAEAIVEQYQAYFAVIEQSTGLQSIPANALSEPQQLNKTDTPSHLHQNHSVIKTKMLRGPSISQHPSSLPLVGFPVLFALIGLMGTVIYYLRQGSQQQKQGYSQPHLNLCLVSY